MAVKKTPDYDPLENDFFVNNASTETAAVKTTAPETTSTVTSPSVPAPRKRGRPAKNPQTAQSTETKQQDFEPIKLLLNYTGSRVITITPAIADHMLKHCNTLNRKLNKRWVAFLSEAIKKGEWQLNGEPIIFSKDLRLIDGQHRLYAIVAAGKEIDSYVTTEVPDENFVSIDTGHARSGSHVLGIGGRVKNSFDVSATLNKINRYKHKNYDFDGAHVVSNRQLMSLLEKYKDVTKSVDYARKFGKGYSKSTIAFCHYILHKIDKELCDTFFTQLSSPTPTIPLIASLRKGTVKEGRAKSRIKQTVVIGSIFKTWNAMRTNDANASAMMTATEEFPMPK